MADDEGVISWQSLAVELICPPAEGDILVILTPDPVTVRVSRAKIYCWTVNMATVLRFEGNKTTRQIYCSVVVFQFECGSRIPPASSHTAGRK